MSMYQQQQRVAYVKYLAERAFNAVYSVDNRQDEAEVARLSPDEYCLYEIELNARLSVYPRNRLGQDGLPL